MKITIVNKHRMDVLGGSEIQCDFIATELTRRGHEVNYVAPGGNQDNYNTTYSVYPCKNEASEITQKILKSEPNVLYWRFNKYFFHENVRKLKKTGCKIIFASSHENDVHWFRYRKDRSLKGNLREMFFSVKEHFGMYYVDAVVVNNKDHLNKLPVNPQVYIPNGMTKKFVNFSWKNPYCAWIANIKRSKRPELFIELAKEPENAGIDFIMVGDIQQDEYLWMNDNKNLPDNLYYLGVKTPEEVSGILKNSRVHVHTCLAEGFPNVFIQAWLQGVPSVTYEFDPSGYITDNNLGFAAEENWDYFVKCVRELIDNSEKRDEMGRNAQLFAGKMFDIENSVTKLEEIMTVLIKKNPTGRKRA